MKTTPYFRFMKTRTDRSFIKDEWIQHVIDNPIYREVQEDERIRLWSKVPEMSDRYLSVILLKDNETVHNAFFDRNFRQ